MSVRRERAATWPTARASWSPNLTEFKTSPILRRKAGLERLASLLDELRELSALREGRPGTFRYRSRDFLHFHYHPDGKIVADVRLSERALAGRSQPHRSRATRAVTRFDVSEEAGQQELLSAIQSFLVR
jgi:hypothetical protein